MSTKWAAITEALSGHPDAVIAELAALATQDVVPNCYHVLKAVVRLCRIVASDEDRKNFTDFLFSLIREDLPEALVRSAASLLGMLTPPSQFGTFVNALEPNSYQKSILSFPYTQNKSSMSDPKIDNLVEAFADGNTEATPATIVAALKAIMSSHRAHSAMLPIIRSYPIVNETSSVLSDVLNSVEEHPDLVPVLRTAVENCDLNDKCDDYYDCMIKVVSRLLAYEAAIHDLPLTMKVFQMLEPTGEEREAWNSDILRFTVDVIGFPSSTMISGLRYAALEWVTRAYFHDEAIRAELNSGEYDFKFARFAYHALQRGSLEGIDYAKLLTITDKDAQYLVWSVIMKGAGHIPTNENLAALLGAVHPITVLAILGEVPSDATESIDPDIFVAAFTQCFPLLDTADDTAMVRHLFLITKSVENYINILPHAEALFRATESSNMFARLWELIVEHNSSSSIVDEICMLIHAFSSCSLFPDQFIKQITDPVCEHLTSGECGEYCWKFIWSVFELVDLPMIPAPILEITHSMLGETWPMNPILWDNKRFQILSVFAGVDPLDACNLFFTKVVQTNFKPEITAGLVDFLYVIMKQPCDGTEPIFRWMMSLVGSGNKWMMLICTLVACLIITGENADPFLQIIEMTVRDICERLFAGNDTEKRIALALVFHAVRCEEDETVSGEMLQFGFAKLLHFLVTWFDALGKEKEEAKYLLITRKLSMDMPQLTVPTLQFVKDLTEDFPLPPPVEEAVKKIITCIQTAMRLSGPDATPEETVESENLR